MTPVEVWNHIMNKAKGSGFETHTRPQNKNTPLWFRVGVTGNTLVISNAISKQPSVRLSMERKITFKDFELGCLYYDQWLKDGNRQEVIKKSQNSSYIFALIAEQRKWESSETGIVM